MMQGGWLERHRTTGKRRVGVNRCVPWRSMIGGTLVLASVVWTVPEVSAAETARRGIPGYGYELASPPSTAGQNPNPEAIGDSGEDVLFKSSGGVADVGNLMPLGHVYRAKRTPSGWVTESLGGPSAAVFPSFGISDWQANWWQVDRPVLLGAGAPLYDAASTDNGNRALVGTKGGDWNRINPTLDPYDVAVSSLGVVATAEDLMGVVESRKARPPLTDGTVDTRPTNKPSLFVSRRRTDGTLDLRQIAQQSGVSMFATTPACEIQLGSPANGVKRGAVDRDGLQRVIWTTAGTGCTTGVRQRVYVTEPFSSHPDAFDISASKCTVSCGTAQPVRFAGASLDTDRIFMTTTQKLLDTDGDTTSDIYEYDFRRLAPDRLQLVTADAAPANVLGVVTVSDAGSHMYFVARGALSDAVVGDDAPSGAAPVAGSPNLYVRIAPLSGGPAVTRFLATLDEADAALWGANARPAVATPDGRYLVLTSSAALTEDKQPGDTLSDVYRVDSTTGQINRAWVTDPAHNGAARSEGSEGPTNGFAHNLRSNFASTQRLTSVAADGSAIVFASKEPLVAGDDNTNSDVFVWTASDGAVSMLSDGHDPQGITMANVQLTSDGSSFMFMTRSQIVPQHTATSLGLYVYRRGGGFPVPAGPPPPCPGDVCQGRLVGTPRFGEPGSGVFFGGGNETPVSPAKPTVRIAGGRSARGTTVRLRVRASAAGRIRIAGSGVRTATRSVTRAGTYTVRVRLSAKGTKNLKRKGRLKVSARVRLSDKTGQSASTRASLTFTTKKRSHRPKSKPKSQASARLAVGSGR